jgi:uncharacterized membrane protein (DUF485 family)
MFEIDVITAMMQLLHWHVMKKESRNFSLMIYTLAPLKWLSLICHIFLYFLTHTKHTYGPVQWFLTFVSHLLLTHTRFYFLCLLLWSWFTTFLATRLHNETVPPTWSLGPNSSTLKMGAVYSPKTSVSAHKTAWDQMRTTCEKLVPWKCRNLPILRWCTVWQGLLKLNDCKRRVPVTHWSNCSI